MRSTQPLRDALAEYDAGQAHRDACWNMAQHDGHVRMCQHQDERDLRKVQAVFHTLTSDRNSFDNCLLTDITYLRQIADLDEI